MISARGFAAFSGKIGNFDAKIEEGIGFPTIGSPSDPILDLTSVDFTSKTGGTLTVSLIETGFSRGAAEEFLSSLTGIYVNSGSEMSNYLGKNDKPFGKSTLLSTGLIDNQSDLVSLPAISGPFSLTEVLTITAGPNNLTSIDAAIMNAPEPASLWLLGAARRRSACWAPVDPRAISSFGAPAVAKAPSLERIEELASGRRTTVRKSTIRALRWARDGPRENAGSAVS